MANRNPSPLTRFGGPLANSGNPGGRPKKMLPRIDEMLAADKLHPYTEIMKLMPSLKEREQAEVWLQLLSYCQAKPKEILDEDDEVARLPLTELIKRVRETLISLEAEQKEIAK